jgi:hypothetical protein
MPDVSNDWLKCTECKTLLAPVVVKDGRTALPAVVGVSLTWVDRADLVCQCGAVRRFTGVEIKENVKARTVV